VKGIEELYEMVQYINTEGAVAINVLEKSNMV